MILHWSILLFFVPLILSLPLLISFKIFLFPFSFWLVSIYNICTTSNEKYRSFPPHNSVQQFRQSAYIVLIHFILLSVIFISISSQVVSKLTLIYLSQSQLSPITPSHFESFFTQNQPPVILAIASHQHQLIQPLYLTYYSYLSVLDIPS